MDTPPRTRRSRLECLSKLNSTIGKWAFILFLVTGISPGVRAIRTKGGKNLCGGVRNRYVCDSENAAVFHICLGSSQYTMFCPDRLLFNQDTQKCDWPHLSDCFPDTAGSPNPQNGSPFSNHAKPAHLITPFHQPQDPPQKEESSSEKSTGVNSLQLLPNFANSKINSGVESGTENTHSTHSSALSLKISPSPHKMSQFSKQKTSKSQYNSRRRNSLNAPSFNSKTKRLIINPKTFADDTFDSTGILRPSLANISSYIITKSDKRLLVDTQEHSTEYDQPQGDQVGRKIDKTSSYTRIRPQQHEVKNKRVYQKDDTKSSPYVTPRKQNTPIAAEYRNVNDEGDDAFEQLTRNKHLTQLKKNGAWRSENMKRSKTSNKYENIGQSKNNGRSENAWTSSYNSKKPKTILSQPWWNSIKSTISSKNYLSTPKQPDSRLGHPLEKEQHHLKTLKDNESSSSAKKQDTKKHRSSRHKSRNKYKPRDNDLKSDYQSRSRESVNQLSDQSSSKARYVNKNKSKPENSAIKIPINSAASSNGGMKFARVEKSKDVRVKHRDSGGDDPSDKKVDPDHAISSLLEDKEISAYKSPIEKYSKRKGKCSSSWCKLPACRCVGPDIPGELDAKEVPQMVLLTFDDSVNGQNMHYYQSLFDGKLRNPNGCPIKATFFVSGDNTDYQLVKKLHKEGHELASHTLSHRSPTTWWATAGYEGWQDEIVGMRQQLSEKSGIPAKEIAGMRAPFLQVGADGQYAMLQEHKFRYDSSMVTGHLYSNHQPPIWPFTLDSVPDSTTCNISPCPTRSYPGLWEVPLVRWYGTNNIACAMPDACTIDSGVKGGLKFMEDNFLRHYRTNRAPLGIFIHASWFSRDESVFLALREFLKGLADKEDVWVVTISQALDWVQRPLRLSALQALDSWAC